MATKQRGKELVRYHKDGTIWAKGRTVAGAAEGYWEWFRKDGTRLRSGHFESGKQTGEWTTYDREGDIYKVTPIKPERPTAKPTKSKKKASSSL